MNGLSEHHAGSRTAATRRRMVTLVGLLALLPYLNSLPGEFCFDDLKVIRDNRLVTGAKASALTLIRTVDYLGAPLYRPLTMLTYYANAHISRSPVGYHVVNVCLHILVTLLAFSLAQTLLGSAQAAMVTAALFAVHPIHTEAVTNIVGRAEVLTTLLVLVSILSSVRAGDERNPTSVRWLLVSLSALFMATLAKENAVAAIPMSALTHLWATGRRRLKEQAALVLPYVALVALCVAMRILVAGTLTWGHTPDLVDNPLAHVPALPRVETAVVVLSQDLALLPLPLWLSADYSFNQVPVVASAWDPQFLAAAALLATLALLLCASARRAPVLVLAAAFTVVPLALTANILFPIGTIKAERFLYLPSVGWCLACGWLCTQQRLRDQRQWWPLVVALVVAVYAGRTWARNQDWRDNFTLFNATVRTSPHSAKAHHNLGVAYDMRGDTDAAMIEFREALRIYSFYDEAAFGIARIYEKKGLTNAALDWYARATQLNWHMARAHLNLGGIRYNSGEVQSAEVEFQAGLEAEPNNPRLLISMSMVRLAQGNYDEARAFTDRAESFVDEDPEVAKLLADARAAIEKTIRP